MKTAVIANTLMVSVSLLTLFAPLRASAQLVPQTWGSVGTKDGDATYSIGARALGFGVEYGSGPNSAKGVDVLKFLDLPLLSPGSVTGAVVKQFISLPTISPYVGLGLYSQDKGVAVSGGVQVGATKNLFLGVGYNTVRGINGQLGVKF